MQNKERKLGLLRWAIALLLTGVLGQVATSALQQDPTRDLPFVSAVWYTSDDSDRFTSQLIEGDIALLHQRLCLSYILLKVFFVQDNVNSNDPHQDPSLTISDETLRRLISQIHQLGMGVVLLPVLLVEDGTWEGAIAPTDLDVWFANWQDILIHYANLFQETSGEVLLIGSELVSLRKQHDRWLNLIRDVRQEYQGLLSYSANWWFDETFYRDVLEMKQWEALDYIGVTGYFEMTNKDDPSLSELEFAWRRNRNRRNVLADLDALSIRYDNKPIVFWEFGYQSKNGANIEPWNFFLASDVDFQEQADAFQAYFNVFSKMPWWNGQGVFTEQVGLPIDDFGYSILDKPAEAVIAEHACSL